MQKRNADMRTKPKRRIIVSSNPTIPPRNLKPRIISKKIDESIERRVHVLFTQLGNSEEWSEKRKIVEKLSKDRFDVDGQQEITRGYDIGHPTQIDRTLACAESVLGPIKKKNILLIGGNLGEAIGLKSQNNNVTGITASKSGATIMRDVANIPSIDGFAENEISKLSRRFDIVLSRNVFGWRKNDEIARKILLDSAKKSNMQIHEMLKDEAPPMDSFLISGWKTFKFETKNSYIIVMKKLGV